MVGGARVELGAKLVALAGNVIEIVATILAIDPDETSVTLQGPEGNVVEVVIQGPTKLNEVDVGDQVVITYTRAVAIAVKPTPVK